MSELPDFSGPVEQAKEFPPELEGEFMDWYNNFVELQNTVGFSLNPDPDDPAHKYDHRAAFLAGEEPEYGEDGFWHMSSEVKQDDHPNRFVWKNKGFLDTKYDKTLSPGTSGNKEGPYAR